MNKQQITKWNNVFKNALLSFALNMRAAELGQDIMHEMYKDIADGVLGTKLGHDIIVELYKEYPDLKHYLQNWDKDHTECIEENDLCDEMEARGYHFER